MESRPHNEPRFGSIAKLEAAFGPANFYEAELFLRSQLEMDKLDTVKLSDEEQTLVGNFCDVLGIEPLTGSEEYKVAARAAKFAKLTWATFAMPDAKMYKAADGTADDMHDFAESLYGQRGAFEFQYPGVTDLVRNMNVELDASGNHNTFAMEVTKLSFAAIDQTAQYREYTDTSFDDELAQLLAGE